MQWEIVIGLETHVQLSTRSKIFSRSSTKFGGVPNMQADLVDLALPGVLPVLNRSAVENAIKFGIAVEATISPQSIFTRKNYFYPDLPKGYQISQFENPVVQGGRIFFKMEKFGKSELVSVQLTRAHLEEDAGKSIHEDSQGTTSVDLNRAGIPLLEIVTEPNIRSATEAVAYAKSLHALVVWIGICDGNMQEGSFRCDVNISIRPFGKTTYNNRVEIKNLNSFRFIEEAIGYEVKRQIELMEDSGTVVQETRLYDPNKRETRAMRSKGNAQDYRYFPDPDLPPLLIEKRWIESIRESMPELPATMRERFVRDFGLSEYDSVILTQSKAMADYFEFLVLKVGSEQAKIAANWLIGDVLWMLNRENLDITETRVTAVQLAVLLQRLTDGTVSNKIAKEVFCTMWEVKSTRDRIAEEIIEGKKLKQISDPDTLEKVIDAVLIENVKLAVEVSSGKEKAFNALIGQAMKHTQGRANPARLRDILEKKITKN